VALIIGLYSFAIFVKKEEMFLVVDDLVVSYSLLQDDKITMGIIATGKA
jgi:hypothetical protein